MTDYSKGGGQVSAREIFRGGYHCGLVFCLLLFTSTVYSSENTHFKTLSGDVSMPSNYINHIIQRHDGFIWMATTEGISRFDGKNFINHKSFPDNLNSLPNPTVNYLLEDHNNQLWAATSDGLARMHSDELNFEQYKHSPANENSIASNTVVHLFEDDQFRLWSATYRGLSLYQPETNDFKSFYFSDDKVELNNVNAIAQKNAQQLWIGNEFGLYVFDIETAKFTPYLLFGPGSKSIEILDLDKDSKGSLWIATAYSGLKKLSAVNQEVTSYNYQADNPNSILSDGLWSVSIDNNDNVWAASWGEGLTQISAIDGSITRYTHNRGDKTSIPSNITTHVLQDTAGVIWVATYDGVALLDQNNVIENFRPIPGDKNSLGSDLAWVFEETEEAIWIGTTEGINRLDKASKLIDSYYSADDSNPDHYFTPIWDMTKANEQTFWLGTEYGLAQFNTQTKQLNYVYELAKTKHNQATIDLLKHPVWTINKNADQSVWIGTNSANLYWVDKDLNLIKDYTDLIYSTLATKDNVQFTDIIEGADGNLWLSTTSGMFFFDLAQSTIMPVRSSQGEVLFDEDWIYAVEKHLDNHYWISSQYNGLSLYKFNPAGTIDRLLHFDSSNSNIVDRSFYTIYPVNEEVVWFTGSKNLYKVDLTTNIVTNYGRSFFESGLTFHENSQFFSDDNLLYLGSNKGVIRFDPQKIKKSNDQPKVYFTGIKSNSKSVATALADPNLKPFKNDLTSVASDTPVHLIKQHVFDYSDTIFTFQFSALDYLNADFLNYAYRVPELDEKWVEIKNRNELTLTNLNAGDYHLEVRATNADLQWSKNVAAIDFTLLPKPWMTWWAKLLYVLSAMAVILVIILLYRSRLLTGYALKHREVQLSQAIWGSGDELWEWDIQRQEIIRTNSSELFDNRHRFFNGTFDDNALNIHPDDVHRLNQKIDHIFTGISDEFDAVYRQKNTKGSWIWTQDRAKVTKWSSDNKPLVINGISRNINAIKKKEERSQLIASAFQSSSDGALILDSDLKIISINEAFTDITGYDERIINKTVHQDLGRISTAEMNTAKLFQHIKESVEQMGSYRNEIFIETVVGDSLPVDLRINCIYQKQMVSTHYVATLTDITYHKKTEKVLKKLANYDSLTGLPNRALMMEKLNQALLQAQHEHTKLAVMFIDLDHFKNINDSLGHSIGDELLVAVAKRLKHAIRQTDTIARIGGDEFTIGVLNYESDNDVIKVATAVLDEMSEPFQLENYELIITPSIGIATYDGSKIDVETLLMQADTAMYQAKEKGRNNFQFFTESMNQAVLKRVDIEMRLRKALQNNELLLHFQPKFCLANGKVSAFEALLRWKDANNVITPPDEFIPIAEETGLIFAIGEYVLEHACQELNRWHLNGFTDISIAVNISAIQFMDKKLVGQVSQMIEKYSIPPMALEIEITESTLIENLHYAVKTLEALHKLSVKLSLDDFGTGFSSLSYLKQFPIHALKIDRSFILDMVNNARDASMVESIVLLAHKLSIEVVAEGVETEEQLAMLATYQIEEVQGYLLSEALSPTEVNGILEQAITISSVLNKTI